MLRLEGACGTCPSSTATMKMGIERALKVRAAVLLWCRNAEQVMRPLADRGLPAPYAMGHHDGPEPLLPPTPRSVGSLDLLCMTRPPLLGTPLTAVRLNIYVANASLPPRRRPSATICSRCSRSTRSTPPPRWPPSTSTSRCCARPSGCDCGPDPDPDRDADPLTSCQAPAMHSHKPEGQRRTQHAGCLQLLASSE